MRSLEDRFNHKFNYPWLLLNDEEFTPEFKHIVSTEAKNVTFGRLSYDQWRLSPGIDTDLMTKGQQKLEKLKIPYAKSTSYRKMCRFYSGYFFRHPLLQQYEYYWRVEPDVKFYCDIDQDPFQMMKQDDISYGYTSLMMEFIPTIETLWKTTLDWASERRKSIFKNNHLIVPNHEMPLINFFVDPKTNQFTGCHFWSNFEIARLDLWNNKDYISYFEHLDRSGGFFYERWGDAPVHSLYLALTLQPHQLKRFDHVGYSHDGYMNCDPSLVDKYKCQCSKTDYGGSWCRDKFTAYDGTPMDWSTSKWRLFK
ncbi:glycosyltransferase family 15 protein [Gorgonomyces haynaldii]|nr:glycosyltransferase family 15 protein [Gorgonomyces haynaldii]